MRSTRILFATALALAAVAIPVSSAAAWSPAGTYDFEGELTWQFQAVGLPYVTCDVAHADVQLNAAHTVSPNPGWVPNGTAGSCTTNVPSCTVDIDTGGHSWPLNGVNIGGNEGPLGIASVHFDVTWSGASCSVAGGQDIVGTVVGDYDDESGCIAFPAAQELSVLTVKNSSGLITNGMLVRLLGTLCETGAGANPDLI